MIEGKVLVVGATGMVGDPVTRRLHRDGVEVRVLTRDPDKARARFAGEDMEGIEIACGDVNEPGSLDAALEGCAALHISLRGGNDPVDYARVELRGVENLVAAAKRQRTGRITYVSGAALDPAQRRFIAVEVKLAAEGMIRGSGLPFTVFRPSHFMESLAFFIRGRRASILGRQPHRIHYVAGADFGRMVSKALHAPEAAGRTFTVFGPQALTMREALEIYCDALHPGVTVGSTPLWTVALAGRVLRRGELRFLAELFEFFDTVAENGDPAEANALLGAPETTLAEWCEARRR